MNKNNPNNIEDDATEILRQLRKQADALIAREEVTLGQEKIGGAKSDEKQSAEIQYLFHELRVHQIELEMQNAELHRLHLAEKKMRERYFDLYDLAPVSYITVDKNGLITEANLASAEMLGVARKDLFKKAFSHFVYNEDKDIYYLHNKKLDETGEPQVCEMRMLKNNTPFWVRMESKISQDENCESVRWSIITDITEKKQSEIELKESANKAVAATIAKSQFLSNMSHEIRTPLNGILGFSQILEETETDLDRKQMFKCILSSVNILMELINNILDLAKIESGNVQLVEEEMDLHEVVMNMEDLFLKIGSHKNVLYTCEIDEKIDFFILADNLRIKQIL